MAASVAPKIKMFLVPKCAQRLGVYRMPCRRSNTLSHGVLERHRTSPLAHDRQQEDAATPPPPKGFRMRPELIQQYPEFLPEPTWYLRDRIKERLERRDMLRRRTVCTVPQFYVGSIMAVTAADPFASHKTTRFVGICIQRSGHGLNAHFTLRNVVDGQGVEIQYEIYSPVLHKIEVLRLEKRLDEELFYLRDADPQYSTIPFNTEVISHPPGAPVPVNATKVKLGPRPWHERWERRELQGIEPLDLPQRFFDRAKQVAKPWEKDDLMRQYRHSVNDVETEQIMREVTEGGAQGRRT